MKKFFGILVILLYSVVQLIAQQNPTLHCVKVLSDGKVTIQWTHPADLTNFLKYRCYYSYDGVNFHLFTELTNNPPDVNSATHPTANANTNPVVYYYIAAVSTLASGGQEFPSDTLATIRLDLYSYNGLARLMWDPPHDPPLPSYSSTYDVYAKHPWDADFRYIGASRSHSYEDTITICGRYIEYKVMLTDMSENCQNVSRMRRDLFYDITGPVVPRFDSVSVDYSTGNTMLGWQPSSSEDTYAYIIYYKNTGGLWVPLDTVQGIHTTFWTDLINDPSDQVYSYMIASLDSCQNSSKMTDSLQTMRTSYVLDVCAKKARISWTPYVNMNAGIAGYDIYYSLNGAPLQLAGSVPASGSSYTITGLIPNQHYKVLVRVKGNNSVTASSAACEFVFIATEEKHLAYITSVSVNDQKGIDISVLTSGDTLPFTSINLYRSNDQNGTFDLIEKQRYSGAAVYTFVDRSVNTDKFIYYYKAEIINECELPVIQSNISHNILLLGSADEGRHNNMQWIEYTTFENGVSYYELYRKLQTEVFFASIETLFPSPFMNYQDDVSELFGYGSDFSYYVEAKPASNPYGVDDVSKSNVVVLKQLPVTYIPNAFNPSGVENRVFKPANSFVDTQNYQMIIYNRYGQMVFITQDPFDGWDGTFRGKDAPIGVYVYIITYLVPDGSKFEQSGTLTLIRR